MSGNSNNNGELSMENNDHTGIAVDTHNHKECAADIGCLSSTKKTEKDEIDIIWPPLTIDMISTSLKVIGDLSPGNKLKIVDNRTHLSVDTSYLQLISRYSDEQGRDKIISFLNHLFVEVERNINIILEEIRNNYDVDNKVCVLEGLICKLAVLLHNYENIRFVYKTDTTTYAKLGVNREKFSKFLSNLFRDLAIPKHL